jgi:enediyne biosynthesis protein E4
MKKQLFVLALLGLPLLAVGCRNVSSPVVSVVEQHYVDSGWFYGDEGDSNQIESFLATEDEINESDRHPVVVSYNENTESETEIRKIKQNADRNNLTVFNDFSFSHALEKSKIDFKHRIVDDAGIDFQFNHYDHGNGLSVADINNDGFFDIYFVTQVGENQLWQNNGDGTFVNITEKARVGLANKISVSATFADIDNDGDADLYVTTVNHGNVLFENGGEGIFMNISDYSGINYKGHSSSAIFFDYDLDGLLDLFLVNVGGYTQDIIGKNGYYLGNPEAFQNFVTNEFREESLLYRNIGANRFTDVTIEAGIQNNSWSGDASIVDLNNDLYPDLYVLNMEGEDTYYQNENGKTFIDATDTYFTETPSGTMGIKFFNFDNDLDQDLYLTDMHSDMGFVKLVDSLEKESLKSDILTNWIVQDEGDVIYGNGFYINDTVPPLQEMSSDRNVENFWPWGVSTGDINSDGYEDVFVTSSMNYRYKYVPNHLYLNNQGKSFIDSAYLLGIEPRQNNEIEKKWFDINCDQSNIDHYECFDRSGTVSKKRGSEISVMGSLGSRSSVIFDIDSDGDLDIVTNEFNDEPLVLINNLTTAQQINYLKIKLEGSISNRDGLNSTVTVYTKNNTYTRYHDGASGYLSHSRMNLYFGLANETEITKIEVRWPSGEISVLDTVETINTLLVIKE